MLCACRSRKLDVRRSPIDVGFAGCPLTRGRGYSSGRPYRLAIELRARRHFRCERRRSILATADDRRDRPADETVSRHTAERFDKVRAGRFKAFLSSIKPGRMTNEQALAWHRDLLTWRSIWYRVWHRGWIFHLSIRVSATTGCRSACR